MIAALANPFIHPGTCNIMHKHTHTHRINRKNIFLLLFWPDNRSLFPLSLRSGAVIFLPLTLMAFKNLRSKINVNNDEIYIFYSNRGDASAKGTHIFHLIRALFSVCLSFYRARKFHSTRKKNWVTFQN